MINLRKKAEGRGSKAEGKRDKGEGGEGKLFNSPDFPMSSMSFVSPSCLLLSAYCLLALRAVSLGLMFAFSFSFSVFAEPPPGNKPTTLANLDTDTARSQSTKLYLYPGRNTVIDFSATSEVIFSIKIGDPSKTVYNTDIPLTTGKAKSLYLTPIQILKFPGATTTVVTNLIVKTVDKDTGNQQIYLFDLYHRKEQVPEINGVAINQKQGLDTDSDRLVWRVDNRVATLADIEQGLRVSIVKGWTSPDDEVVGKVREFLAIAHNTPKITLIDAASKVGLDLAVISSLATTGLDFRFIEQPGQLEKPNEPVKDSISQD